MVGFVDVALARTRIDLGRRDGAGSLDADGFVVGRLVVEVTWPVDVTERAVGADDTHLAVDRRFGSFHAVDALFGIGLAGERDQDRGDDDSHDFHDVPFKRVLFLATQSREFKLKPSVFILP